MSGVVALPAAELSSWCKAHGQPYYDVSPFSKIAEFGLPLAGGVPTPLAYGRPRMFAGRVKDADALPVSGYLWTADNYFIAAGLCVRDDMHKSYILDRWHGVKDGKPHLISQPYVARVEAECIYFGGYAHPGHYLGQTLTKLALLNWLPQIKHLPIAVYDNLSPKELDYLDIVGFPADRRIVIPSSGATRFDAVWMLSSPLRRETTQPVLVWAEAIWWLRQATAHISQRSSARRRIYIPRAAGDITPIVNKPLVSAIVAEAGFEVLDIAAMTAREIIEAASAAEIIVTSGGVDGDNTIFSPPDCAIIELTAPGWAGAFGPLMFAATIRQGFTRIVGTPAPGGFAIDAAALKSAIAKAKDHLRMIR